MNDQNLIRTLMDVIKSNTAAMENVAKAIESNNAKNEKLTGGMDRMTATIAGAQRKIGGELGPIIDGQKASAKKLHDEAEAAVRARGAGGGS